MKKEFILCNDRFPKIGKLLIIKLTDGTLIEAWRTESNFDEKLGYLYEDIQCADHYPKDVIAWKYK